MSTVLSPTPKRDPAEPLLSVRDLTKYYPITGGLFLAPSVMSKRSTV